MRANRSSGLDFSDRGGEDHSDAGSVYGGIEVKPHLQRNKSERLRIQTLQERSRPSLTENRKSNIAQKIDLWMINEGWRTVFLGVWILLHLLVAVLGFVHYQLKDNLTIARKTFGVTYAISRTAALVLYIDVIFILLPVCRNLISLLRRTPLNHIIPFDQSIAFHKATGWSIVAWTAVHILSHMVNFYRLAISDPTKSSGKRFLAFLEANFTTGPGVTGWIMTLTLGVMVFFATGRRRREHFEWFWYSHHLFIVFFVIWQLHGMFCMIKPDRPPYCSENNTGVFWKYWLAGGLVWAYERILREVRSRHRTYISKVIQHPSNVVELQIKKEKTTVRAGQYIFLSCPEISYFEWHPFTLTSAPEEDYLSVHVRVVGDFTRALANSVGCDIYEDTKDGSELPAGGSVIGTKETAQLGRVLPRVMVDGPFGCSSEDFMNYETVFLVGAGIGVTPFASILKSIWYRMNGFNYSHRTRLSKVYFTWVVRDYGHVEWFHSLLEAIEEQDSQNKIEISIYLTGGLKEDDVNNIMVLDVGAEKDTITSLKAPTHFGRPNWDTLFFNIAKNHPATDVGVFYCGPQAVSAQIHATCNKYSEPGRKGREGTRFFFKKENF